MPRRCCVPACKGNYATGPKVSVFFFPRDEDVKDKWIKAIHRENFIPTKQSVVCELHFHSIDVERSTSMYNPKSGELLSAPLDRPRLKKGAVPALLPGCPTYLSTVPASNRENPDDRRERLENSLLSAAIDNSFITREKEINAVSFKSLEELKLKVSGCAMDNDWLLKDQGDKICLMLIKSVPTPKVACYVIINNDLQLSVYCNDVEICSLGKTKLPRNVSRIDTLSDILSDAYNKFTRVENRTVEDNISLVIDILNTLSETLPEKRDKILFLKEQISCLTCKKSVLRYKWESIILWSLIYSISPHAYRFLRKCDICTLPCPETLSRLCSKLSTNPVMEQDSSNFLHYLTRKVGILNDEDKCVVLLMDEIHLKSQIDYKGGNIVGQAFNSTECAKSAYVFMVHSVGTQYKDVAHILPVKTMDSESLFTILEKTILKLESIGFEVIGVISDNNAINSKAVSYFSNPPEIKIKYDHPCSGSGNRPLYFLIDSVHILKCIRNNWLNEKEQVMHFPDFNEDISGGVASMKALKSLHVLEKGNLLKYGSKLTLKSLYPSSLERQNVKLALQVFCDNTAIALRELGPQKSIENWKGTANYIEIIWKWWCVVNVKTTLKGQRLRNEFQEPFTASSDHLVHFLNTFLLWLDKNEMSGFSTQTHSALKHTTLGLLDLSKYWIIEKKKSYFLTGKLQTDQLEDRFGKYRQMSGGNYHVSVRQVFETESKLRAQSFLSVVFKSQKVGDVIITKDDVFLQDSDCDESHSVIMPNDLRVKIDLTDIEEAPENVFPILYYISGYAAYTVSKNCGCEYCKIFLTADRDQSGNEENTSLISATDRGGLCYPSEDVVKCVSHVYAVVQKLIQTRENLFLRQTNQRNVVFENTMENLPEKLLEGHNCANGHLVSVLLRKIVRCAINILLNNYRKRVNDVLTKKNVTQYKRFKSAS